MSATETLDQPVVPYTVIDPSGEPYLLGSRCGACGATHLGHFDNCPKCAARGSLEDIRLASEGTLYNFTIVHRSLPGVIVPFISAVVDLEGGGTVRGNLLDIEPDPAAIEFDMAVRVVFRSAAEAVEGGEGYLAHFFVPARKETAA